MGTTSPQQANAPLSETCIYNFLASMTQESQERSDDYLLSRFTHDLDRDGLVSFFHQTFIACHVEGHNPAL